MIAALLLALWAQGRDSDAALLAEPPVAHWEAASKAAAVGEPLALTLVVQHAPAARCTLGPDWLEYDYSWLELAPARLDPTGAASETRWRVQLASLEAGARELPTPQLSVELPGGGKAAVVWQPASLEFGAALAQEEDVPRPPRDFRPVGSEPRGSPWLWSVLAGLALLVAGVLAGWWLRARRERPVPQPSSAQRLAALRARDLDDAETVRELHYELTALLRGEIDQRHGASRAALTDDEWLAQVAGRFDAESASELAELVAASRAAKYGAARPTRWAVEESLSRAQRVLESPPEPVRSAA